MRLPPDGKLATQRPALETDELVSTPVSERRLSLTCGTYTVADTVSPYVQPDFLPHKGIGRRLNETVSARTRPRRLACPGLWARR